MRAAYYRLKGPAVEVLKVGDLPSPEPGPGEVRVRVVVSGVNPSDTKQRNGWGGDQSMPFPLIVPHNDGSGVVEAVGLGVPASRLGERVWIYEAQHGGRAFGTAAESVVVPAANVVGLPDGASFDDGACLGVPGMTAHRLLFGDGGIQGQNVLVQGGAGSVGHLAVQLARWAGAKVIATVGSSEQAEIAAESGAHLTLNYKTDDVPGRVTDFLGAKSGVDRVIEVSFVRNLELNTKILKSNGIISTYSIGEETTPATVSLWPLLIKGITVHYTMVYAMTQEAHQRAADDLNSALSAGALRPHIARRFPLSKIAAAHDLLGNGGAGGKVLIEIG